MYNPCYILSLLRRKRRSCWVLLSWSSCWRICFANWSSVSPLPLSREPLSSRYKKNWQTDLASRWQTCLRTFNVTTYKYLKANMSPNLYCTKWYFLVQVRTDKSVGFSHLQQRSSKDIAACCVQLLPALCSHLENCHNHFQVRNHTIRSKKKKKKQHFF